MADFAPHDLTNNKSHSPYIVAASSAHAIGAPYKAFDNSAADYWLTATGSGTNQWLRLDIGFGNAKRLDGYSVKVTAGGGDSAPKNWYMQGSVDSWVWDTLDTVTNQTGWADNEKRDFTCDVATTAYRYFRIYVLDSVSNADYIHIAELYLDGADQTPVNTDGVPHDLTSNTSHSPYVTSASSYYTLATDALCALDREVYAYTTDGAGDPWIGSNAGVEWWKVDLGVGNSKCLKWYTLYIDTEFTRAPKDWTMEGSTDDSTWHTVDTVSDETSWAATARTYTCDSTATAYRYWRINITANNGDETYTRITEISLVFGDSTSGIKTINGLAKASVKTVDGLAIASMKTWDGLA